MGERSRFESGRWWRFSGYELRDGLIRPADGATLEEYDPWAHYELGLQRQGRKGSERPVQPYESLVKLAQEVRLDSRRLPTPSSEDIICDWCRSYGLLGIVPHYYPVLPADRREYVLSGSSGPKQGQPINWVWRGGYWNTETGDPPQLDEELAKFFPEASESRPTVPSPTATAFWNAYAEPVDRFLMEANRLGETLVRLSHDAAAAQKTLHEAAHTILLPTAEELLLEDHPSEEGVATRAVPMMKEYLRDGRQKEEFYLGLDLYRGLHSLNSLVAAVTPVIVIPEAPMGFDDKYRLEWRFPSLLSSLAMMVIHDLSQGHHIHICQKCHAPFQSPRPDALYCSEKCKNTVQKRRQRERQRSPRDT